MSPSRAPRRGTSKRAEAVFHRADGQHRQEHPLPVCRQLRAKPDGRGARAQAPRRAGRRAERGERADEGELPRDRGRARGRGRSHDPSLEAGGGDRSRHRRHGDHALRRGRLPRLPRRRATGNTSARSWPPSTDDPSVPARRTGWRAGPQDRARPVQGRLARLEALLDLPRGPAPHELHASVRVNDLPRSTRFYAWLFGAEPGEWTHRYSIFVRPELRGGAASRPRSEGPPLSARGTRDPGEHPLRRAPRRRSLPRARALGTRPLECSARTRRRVADPSPCVRERSARGGRSRPRGRALPLAPGPPATAMLRSGRRKPRLNRARTSRRRARRAARWARSRGGERVAVRQRRPRALPSPRRHSMWPRAPARRARAPPHPWGSPGRLCRPRTPRRAAACRGSPGTPGLRGPKGPRGRTCPRAQGVRLARGAHRGRPTGLLPATARRGAA